MEQFKFFHENEVSVNGAVHVGACRGEELIDYDNFDVRDVVWIEANPEVYEELLTMIKRTPTQVNSHTFNNCISNQDDVETDFHLIYGPDAGPLVGNKGCSSLLKPQGWMSGWYRKSIKVNTITLDTLLERNNLNYQDYQLLDMDTQGSELMVLQGADKLLENIQYIITEATWADPYYEGNVMFDDLSAYLESKGFVHQETYKHCEEWGDSLFIRK